MTAPRNLVWWTLLLLLAAGSGCGPVLQQSRASDKFRAVFGCKAERVSRNGTGYRVEGCGVTAYLQCFDDNRDYDDPVEHALFQGDDTCMIEHSERRAMPKLQVEPTTRVTEHHGEKHMRSSVSILGAHLTLLAAPAQDSERIVVVVRPLRKTAMQCDEAAMWIEGVPVLLEGTRDVRNERGHEIQFTLPRQSLEDVGSATRVVLRTCGEELVFDDAAKKALDLFEVQFREQLSQLST